MSEWWTYRLSDFLMFSPRTYWRLVELYNLDWWPLHMAALLAGFIALALAVSRKAMALRLMAVLLAAAWLWVGWAFHWQRYAAINWAAQYAALAFALQALLLLALGLRGGPAASPPRPGMSRLGLTLAAAGLFAYPFMAWAVGRPWLQAEVFGMAPEPTALATLGLLLVSPVAGARLLLLCAIPCVSLLVGAATLWTFSH
jgi:hypothetical protein